MQTNILQRILDNQKRTPHTLSLEDMGITPMIVQNIYDWAKDYACFGELASYIPQLLMSTLRNQLSLSGIYSVIKYVSVMV